MDINDDWWLTTGRRQSLTVIDNRNTTAPSRHSLCSSFNAIIAITTLYVMFDSMMVEVGEKWQTAGRAGDWHVFGPFEAQFNQNDWLSAVIDPKHQSGTNNTSYRPKIAARSASSTDIEIFFLLCPTAAEIPRRTEELRFEDRDDRIWWLSLANRDICWKWSH